MIRDDIMAVKKEINDLKEQSLAMDLIKDYKKQNKRQFAVIITILIMWFLTIAYLVYLLNDIGTIETKQSISGVDKIENSTINNGGN